jgi:hypothetical protein
MRWILRAGVVVCLLVAVGLGAAVWWDHAGRSRERAQTPRPPFPYASQEVAIASPVDGVRLAGTRTLPAGPGPFPGLVLLSVAGPTTVI